MANSSNSGELSVGKLDLVGREKEIAQFNEILERNQPALIVLSGETGMGKTSLLHCFEARAYKEKWRTAFKDKEGALCIKPLMTDNDFCNRVRELLDLPFDESLINSKPDFGASKAGEHEYGQVHGGQIENQRAHFRGIVQFRSGRKEVEPNSKTTHLENSREMLHKTTQDEQKQQSHKLRRHTLHPLIEQLRRYRLPALLLIDGYRPGVDLAYWFKRIFINDMKQAEGPIVVVVADLPRHVSTLISFADASISLGTLNRKAIRKLFKKIGEQTTPPMKTDEMEQYIEEVCKKPEIFGSLIRILQLAQPATS